MDFAAMRLINGFSKTAEFFAEAFRFVTLLIKDRPQSRWVPCNEA